MQDAKMTSTFQLKDEANRKRYQKKYTSSALGRGGAFSSPVPVIIEEHGSKEVVFKRVVDKALAEKNLDALHEAWAQWESRTSDDVPYDNRELKEVLEKAAGIAQRQLKLARLGRNRAEIGLALQAVEEVEQLAKTAVTPDSHAYAQETSMQDTRMTSSFQLKEEVDRKRYQKMYTSSALGRGGGFSSPVPVITKEHGTKEVAFKRDVDKALADDDLDALHEAWAQWKLRSSDDVPLDNRELALVRRQAVDIARRQLGEAVGDGCSAAVEQAMKAADRVADVFPVAPEVRSSLQYKAARNHGE